jgi:hypothetical protein
MGFFDRGYWRTSDFLWKYVESYVGPIPTTHPSFQGISRSSFILPPVFFANDAKMRWNNNYHRFEVKTTTLYQKSMPSPFPTAVQRLLHNLVSGCQEPYDLVIPLKGRGRPPR